MYGRPAPYHLALLKHHSDCTALRLCAPPDLVPAAWLRRRLSNTGSRRGAKSNGGSLTNTLRLPIRDSPEPQPLGSSLTRSKNL